MAVVPLGSLVEVVVLFLWFFDDCWPVDVVVAFATPAASGDGPGSARAIPPPDDSAPTMRSAPAAARV